MTLDDVDVMLDHACDLLDRPATRDEGVAVILAVCRALSMRRDDAEPVTAEATEAPGQAAQAEKAAQTAEHEAARQDAVIQRDDAFKLRDQAQHERDEAIRENERLTKELAVVTKERDVAGVRWVWLDRVASWLYTLPERGGDRA